MKLGNILLTNKTKLKGNSNINEQIKHNIYLWITHHPQVVQSIISNYFLKVMFDDQIEPQLLPKFLLQVSVQELNNSLVSDTDDTGIKNDRYEDDNIVISDYILRLLLPPQLKKLSAL